LLESDEKSLKSSFGGRKVSRREALSTGAKIGLAAGLGLVVGAVGGYFGGTLTRPTTPTVKTVTETVTAPTTITSTITKTVTIERTITPTTAVVPPGVHITDWGAFPDYLKGTKIAAAVQLIDSLVAVQNLLPQFERETGISVDFILLPEEELHNKVLVELSSGAGKFAVVMDDCMFVPQFAENNWIVPLDEFIENVNLTYKPIFNLDDFLAKSVEIAKYKGKLYGLPIYAETTVLIFRKDIFKENNINIPETMEDLAKVCEDLKNVLPEGVYPIALRGYPGEGANVYIWTGFLKAFGGDFFDKNWEPIIDSDEAIKATGFYAELLSKYGPPGSANYHWDDIQTFLQQGKAVMAIEASDFIGRIEDPSQSPCAGKFGYSLVPKGPAGRFPSVFAFELMINAASTKEQREAAWIFVSWATSKKLQLEAAVSQRFTNVVRESVMSDPLYLGVWGKYRDWLDAHTKSLKEIASIDYRPRIPVWRDVGNRIGIAVSEVIAKAQLGADPYEEARKALQAAASDIREIMKKAGYIK
jgi:ABC-type glycerol-3-phosphate transport system substrate-binding protein